MCDLLVELGSEVKGIFGSKNSRASLASTVKDWCETLTPATKQHLFDGGENRVLELMTTVTPDESAFVQRLAKAVSSLRVEDWNKDTTETFLIALRSFKDKVEEFDKKKDRAVGAGYRLIVTGKDGRETVQTFPQTKTSPKAELLRNEITTALEEMGRAISEAEKRQVLMAVLEKLL